MAIMNVLLFNTNDHSGLQYWAVFMNIAWSDNHNVNKNEIVYAYITFPKRFVEVNFKYFHKISIRINTRNLNPYLNDDS